MWGQRGCQPGGQVARGMYRRLWESVAGGGLRGVRCAGGGCVCLGRVCVWWRKRPAQSRDVWALVRDLIVGNVCGSWRVWPTRLYGNDIGDEGAAAIGAGLAHVPSLTTLEYVRPRCSLFVCGVVLTMLGVGSGAGVTAMGGTCVVWET